MCECEAKCTELLTEIRDLLKAREDIMYYRMGNREVLRGVGAERLIAELQSAAEECRSVSVHRDTDNDVMVYIIPLSGGSQ